MNKSRDKGGKNSRRPEKTGVPADAGIEIHWFPGHMAKTRREMTENMRHVDMVAEITDARIPMSSRNPDIAKIAGEKPRLVVLNKADLADEKATRDWVSYFKGQGMGAVVTEAKNARGIAGFKAECENLLREKIENNRQKGVNKTMRVMVCGIPNVGKSAFINAIAGGKRVRVEDRPGVTRGRQWINVGEGLDLMDTPGVLWPKFEDREVAVRLAYTGAIRDRVLDTTELALMLLVFLRDSYPERVAQRYKIDVSEFGDKLDLFEAVCRSRGMLLRGGEPDYDRCAVMLLDEFRGGRLGRITLELPPGEK